MAPRRTQDKPAEDATAPENSATEGQPQGFTAALFEKGWALRETYDTYLRERKANRTMLRSLADQGMLSADESAELDELYPKRADHGNGAEDAPEDAAEPAADPQPAAA